MKTAILHKDEFVFISANNLHTKAENKSRLCIAEEPLFVKVKQELPVKKIDLGSIQVPSQWHWVGLMIASFLGIETAAEPHGKNKKVDTLKAGWAPPLSSRNICWNMQLYQRLLNVNAAVWNLKIAQCDSSSSLKIYLLLQYWFSWCSITINFIYLSSTICIKY